MVLSIKVGGCDESDLGAGDGAKWRELFAEFLIIDGVIKVFNVKVDTLKQATDTLIAVFFSLEPREIYDESDRKIAKNSHFKSKNTFQTLLKPI